MALLVLDLALTVVGLLVLYVVIRKAVHHGILDADEARRAKEERRQLARRLGDHGHSDDRIS